MNNTIKILNTELEFNFSDADDMERFEKAHVKAEKLLNEYETDGKKASEAIREYCKIVFNCFDEIFGDGTAKKIFGEKTNLNSCIEAFKDLIKAKIDQEKEFENEITNIKNKYSPNRAVRRTKK